MSHDEKHASSAITSLDDDPPTSDLTLISAENQRITISRQVASLSELLRTMTEGDRDENEIPLPNVKSHVLQKVVQYLSYHSIPENTPKPIEKPLRSSHLTEIVSSWDAEYIDIDQDLLFELILAANYMDIKSLLDLACAKIASLMKGKSVEQVRALFNIVNDFTPEEEMEVMEQMKWAEGS